MLIVVALLICEGELLEWVIAERVQDATEVVEEVEHVVLVLRMGVLAVEETEEME